MPHLARIVGSAAMVLAAVAALNALWQHSMWLVIFPALVVVYCAVEFAFDNLWRIDFRSTALLGSYVGCTT